MRSTANAALRFRMSRIRGRVSSMLAAESPNEFRWSYLPGSDLKESIAYPNGDVVRWEYEPRRDLLTLVSNATHSAYRYTYDEAGRRIIKNDEHYAYNVRNELILATNVVTGAEFAYCYDDIGNRLWSREFGTNTTYTANNLNQYTEIVRGGVVEHPAFDVDGSQTDITTSTGRWLVEYNGENRPVRWTCAASDSSTSNSVTPTFISMSYDRMGRRVRSGDETFVYDDYLNIGSTIWDPTEPVATRPLVSNVSSRSPFSFFHDGGKSVSGIVTKQGIFAICYEYSPFGFAITDLSANQCQSMENLNQFRFSSEYADIALGLVYYNYRHYNPRDGRWMSFDRFDSNMLYLYLHNSVDTVDFLGCISISDVQDAIGAFLSNLHLFNQVMGRATRCMSELHQWATNPLKSGGSNDKYAHCLASCELSGNNSCGPALALAAGIAKEIGDVIALIPGYLVKMIGFSEFSEKVDDFLDATSLLDSYEDLQADGTGIGCHSAGTDCECCCKENYTP